MVGTREPTGWKPVALDGGYGWIVVLASFSIHVIVDGFLYSFGVIAESLVKEFNGTNAEVSTILCILTGLTFGIGPISSAICNKIGCRLTTIIGILFMSCGCAISYNANSMTYLIGSIGLIMGTGFGLLYCPSIVIVTMYFEKYRSLATGFTVCGAGVGAAVFSVIVSHLIIAFGWRQLFLIYAGIILLCIPCVLLYRPVEFVPIYDNDKREEEEWGRLEEVVKMSSIQEDEEENNVNEKLRSAFSHSAVNKDSETEEGNLQRVQSLGEGIVRSRTNTVTESSGYLNFKDVFYPGSVTGLKEYQRDAEHFRSITSLHSHNPRDKNHQLPSLKEENEEILGTQSIWRTITKLLDLDLFTDPVYVVYAISNFLTSVGFYGPSMFMPMNAENILGLSKESAAQTVSAYGIANIIGRIVFGFICDRQFPCKYGKNTARNRLWIYNWTLMLCGLLSCFVFLMTDEYVFKAYCFFFGFLISSCVCLASVVLVDMVGIDRLTSAFGLLLLVQGIATFVGPPIAGVLFDLTKRYDWTFAFCGICLFFSGIMLFIIPFIQKDKSEEIRLVDERDKHTQALLQ